MKSTVKVDPAHTDFEKFFRLSLDMLCIAGTDGYFKTINPAFTRCLGYGNEELLSRPFLELIHPDDIKATQKEIEKLSQGQTTINFVNRYLHNDGHYLLLSWSANVDAQNGLLYAAARDVTEEFNARSRLLQIERALDKESIIAQTDINGTIVEVNDMFCEISGYTREELIGQNHRILKSGVHSDAFYKKLWDTISSGRIWSGMFENRRKDGRHYFVHSVITPIVNSTGEITNYLSFRFDATRYINLKRELSRTLDVLNETGAIAKVGGWELDIATGELTWTDETFSILEVEKRADHKPVLPQGLNLFIDEHKPIIENAVNRAINYGEPYSLELQAKTAKGNVLWVYTNGKANYKNGKIVSLSGTIQDIDEVKRTEAQYEAERLKSIQNAKLASLGELSAGIAHEINNPLMIISGSVELVSKFMDKPEILKSSLEDINRSCQRITRIVQSLKKFSRSDGESIHEKHSLNDIVKESITLTDARVKRADVTLSYHCHNDAYILCDEVEIEQVIVNLINNAIDAVKNQDVREITVDLDRQDNWLILRVIDSGPGIPETIHDKLFIPFFTTKENGKGTGLGLSISRGILENHSASIALDTQSETTCFVLKFPVYSGDTDAA